MSALDHVREPLIPARPASAHLSARAWTPNGANFRPGTSQSTSRRPVGSSDGANPWDVPPGSLPAYYEHLAPSRWKDAKLDETQRAARASRLHEDATRRQARARARGHRDPPAHALVRAREVRGDVGRRASPPRRRRRARRVAKRAEFASPDPPQTGIMRYTGSHDEFEGRLEPAPRLPETTRVAGLVKQYYAERASRLRNRRSRFEHYAGLAKRPLSDEERRVLGFDDVPEVPDASDMRAKAEAELAAAKELRRARARRFPTRAKRRATRRSGTARRASDPKRRERRRCERIWRRWNVARRRTTRRCADDASRRIARSGGDAAPRRASPRARERREMLAKFDALATERRKETAEGTRGGANSRRSARRRNVRR